MSGSVGLTSRVALLDIEPALGAQLCADEFREAQRSCVATLVGLRRGRRVAWDLLGSDDPVASAFLVIRGVLTRRLVVGDRRGSELLGPGDVFYPSCEPGERMVVSETSWRVEETVLLAVLDERLHRCLADWPRLLMALHERSCLRSHSLLVRLAMAEQPQIARRVHLVLWHLADRWGTIEEHGVFLPLRLSRVALADLVCSTRESVSRSLGVLERRGVVRARGSGYFLRFPSPAELQGRHPQRDDA
jgi:CRP/FNR family cyclic AMP-dependent transcriptional regulator